MSTLSNKTEIMDNIPKELEENEIKLEFICDPETKCLTMKTYLDSAPEDFDAAATKIIPHDPLHQSEIFEADLEKMTELDRLIYSERRRLLNLKIRKKPDLVKDRRSKDCPNSEMFETDSYCGLTPNEKSKLRMRKYRERESSEEREFRKFRVRIVTMKSRLLQKLRNFENETLLKEMSKRSIDRIRQQRLEMKANESPAQRALRKSRVNFRGRLMHLRRKAFQTPEELLAAKEKRSAYMHKIRSRYTEEQLRAKMKIERDKARERRRKNYEEWKKVEMAVKGAPMEDKLCDGETMDNRDEDNSVV